MSYAAPRADKSLKFLVRGFLAACVGSLLFTRAGISEAIFVRLDWLVPEGDGWERRKSYRGCILSMPGWSIWPCANLVSHQNPTPAPAAILR